MMMNNRWTRFLLPAVLALVPLLSNAQVTIDVSVNTPPPELPVYDQPPIPADGYLWTPGFWAWSDDDQDYYWVPGTWVETPQPDYLWTPGYWGFVGGAYAWHGGYWGPHVGFYGGVDYGHGYGGEGYEGGYWQGGHLFYNRSVNNISNVHITNVYNKTVINNVTVNRVSFNGGNGGTRAAPTAADQAAARERHIDATPQQRAHVETARSTPALRASQNQGHPAIGATARPGSFSGEGVVATKRGGTMSVMPPQHQQASPQRQQPAQRPAAEAPPRAEGQPRPAENAPREQPGRVNPPPAARPAPPRPAERAPEHADEHEHH
jgi:hypothetical protein